MKFKVGDKVRVVKDLLGSNLIGGIYKIITIDEGDMFDIEAERDNGTSTYFSSDELELINE